MTSGARRTLTSEGLDRLLERLGGAAAYEALRRRLADFFDWKGVQWPEAASDETLDRVATRLTEGEAIDHLRGYVYGVARHVLQERIRGQIREAAAAAAWTALRDDTGRVAAESEKRVGCLVRCLGGLTPEERDLIVAYHRPPQPGEPKGPEARRALARRLGMSDGALRTRAHRLRLRLEECLRVCLQGLGDSE